MSLIVREIFRRLEWRKDVTLQIKLQDKCRTIIRQTQRRAECGVSAPTAYHIDPYMIGSGIFQLSQRTIDICGTCS